MINNDKGGKKTNLYICHTAYHLLITLIKALNSQERNELMLCQTCLLNAETVRKIQESNIFQRVILYENIDTYTSELDLRTNIFTRSRILKQRVKCRFNIDSLKNKEIFIFNDVTFVGKTLNIFRIKYNLIEDGLDCFKNTIFLNCVDKKNNFREMIKLILGISIRNYGRSFYTKTIEVNDGNGILLNKPRKIRIVPRNELLGNLSEFQRDSIVNIFFEKSDLEYLHSLNLEDSCMLITQPLSEDELISEEEKVKLYKYLIETYGTSRIYIKVHPRDLTDYQEKFPECEILKLKKCPLEVFSFVEGFHFKKVITAFSTAVQSISYCDEKIIMGQEWVQKFCKG